MKSAQKFLFLSIIFFMIKVNSVKPSIKLYSPDEPRNLCSLIVPHNKAGELNVNVKEDSYGNGYRFIIELKNKFGKLLGFEQYTHFENTDYMTGLLINVIPEYRRKNYFFGEILRLASIIQMLENNIKTFSIKSKDTAIYFHAKYKFKPSVTSFQDRNKLLDTVAKDTAPAFKDIALKAKALADKISSQPSAAKQRNFSVEANKLFTQYINRSLKEKNINNHKFNWVMDMTLEQKNILENKDYFNSLFAKHGIDYEI